MFEEDQAKDTVETPEGERATVPSPAAASYRNDISRARPQRLPRHEVALPHPPIFAFRSRIRGDRSLCVLHLIAVSSVRELSSFRFLFEESSSLKRIETDLIRDDEADFKKAVNHKCSQAKVARRLADDA